MAGRANRAKSGRYTPVNRLKYRGNADNIVYRSWWERQLMRWCDENPKVEFWSSEEIVIPYTCKTDGQRHRYFVDMWIGFTNGTQYLVEIKPAVETMPPKPRARKTQRFMEEVLTYAKNTSKWEAAKKFAADNNMYFSVWTEHTLRKLGIKLLNG